MADLDIRQSTRDAFAQRLRELRITRGFRTARRFAAKIGIDENRYTRYERAEVEPTLELITRICEALGVSPNTLFGFDTEEARSRTGFAETVASSPTPVTASASGTGDGTQAIHIPATMAAEAWDLAGELARRALVGLDHKQAYDALKFFQTRVRYHQQLVENPFAGLSNILKDPLVMKGTPSERAEVAARLNRFAAGVIKGRPLSDR